METWYSPFGNTANLNGTNCNNYANTLAQFAGIVDQYTSFASRFNAPGFNNGLIGSAKTANIVNAFNASSKASSNESKLWVSLSGAVITWDGRVVSGSKS